MTPLLLLALALASAPAEEEPLHDAEIRAAKALALWEAGSYLRAAEYFLEAFELSSEPTQLRNAAKAYEAGDAIDEARATWRRYLELQELSPGDREEAEARLAALHPPVKTATIAAPIPTRPPPAAVIMEAPLAEPVRWEPWVLTAAGAVAAAIGGVLLFRSERDLHTLEDRLAIEEDGEIVGIGYQEAVAEERRIESWRIASSAVIGVGAAAVIAGLSWWWFEW